MTPLFKKATCLLLTVLCMNTQAFEAKLTVNGCDVATLAKNAGRAFLKQADKALASTDKALISACNAFNGITIPCLWQYKDGNLHTTHMHPGHLLGAGLYGGMSLAAFYKAWDKYQESKQDFSKQDSYGYVYPKSENRKKDQKLAALGYFVGGCMAAGIAAVILCGAPRVVTTAPAQFIQGL